MALVMSSFLCFVTIHHSHALCTCYMLTLHVRTTECSQTHSRLTYQSIFAISNGIGGVVLFVFCHNTSQTSFTCFMHLLHAYTPHENNQNDHKHISRLTYQSIFAISNGIGGVVLFCVLSQYIIHMFYALVTCLHST